MNFFPGEYGFVRCAAFSPKLKVGNISYNLEEMKKCIISAENSSVSVALFPEMGIPGYTCGDLFHSRILQAGCEEAIDSLLEFLAGREIIVIAGMPVRSYSKLYNCAMVLTGGVKPRVAGIVPKKFHPNYSEFYDLRWFADGRDAGSISYRGVEYPADTLFSVNGHFKFGIEICEDLWVGDSPSAELTKAGAHIIFNLSASNEIIGKNRYRRDLVKIQSARLACGYLYSSAGPHESTADTVFSGHLIAAENGKILSESGVLDFEGGSLFTDFDIDCIENERLRFSSYKQTTGYESFNTEEISVEPASCSSLLRNLSPSPFVPSSDSDKSLLSGEIFDILAAGLMKRLLHTGAKNVVLGVSGGLDSTLSLLVCISAFGRLGFDMKGIVGISMPGLGTSDRTRNNGRDLSMLTGITYKEISIEKAVRQHFADIGHDERNEDVVYENAQARERTQIIMDVANQYGGLAIGTGDLSEIALGWNTFNGDQMSMYSVISGVPKTLVKDLIYFSSQRQEPPIQKVLGDIIDTPISPELTSSGGAQLTEEILGSYAIHDFILFYFLRYSFGPRKIFFLLDAVFGTDYDKETLKKHLEMFFKRFFRNQFKRNAMPDGVKLGTVALSQRADWRMPSDADPELWLKEIYLL